MINGLVTELAYVLFSKSRFCGFESHLGHHLRRVLAELVKASVSKTEDSGFESQAPCHSKDWNDDS